MYVICIHADKLRDFLMLWDTGYMIPVERVSVCLSLVGDSDAVALWGLSVGLNVCVCAGGEGNKWN